jgi:hypothetical protein
MELSRGLTLHVLFLGCSLSGLLHTGGACIRQSMCPPPVRLATHARQAWQANNPTNIVTITPRKTGILDVFVKL